jgi:phage terminase large subunit-like protein
LSFTQTLDAIRHVTWMFPQSRRKIIEGKANGDAVIDSLKHEIPGIVVFEPGRDSKEGRATAVSPYIVPGTSTCRRRAWRRWRLRSPSTWKP